MTCFHTKIPTDNSASKALFIPDDKEALANELTRLAGHINAANYRFLKLLAALVTRSAWGGHGIKSPAHWLNYYCGISLGPAREKVRVALALQQLPLIDAEFSTGTISYSKVRAMTRAATPQNEHYWLNIAKHGTACHVEKLVRQYQYAERLNSNDHAKAQQQARELSWRYEDDGMLVIRGRLPPEEGAAFVKAMEVMLNKERAKLWQRVQQQRADAEAEQPKSVSAETFLPPDDDADKFTQKRADALSRMAEHFLATTADGEQAQSSGDKYQVVIHLRQGVDAETNTAHHCALDNGPMLAPATVKRLVSDVSLVTVLEDVEGNVLNVGRKTRSVPPAIRRALTIRDKGCRFPGCCESRFVDAHHIKHWCGGGETSLDNLVLLCRKHHRLLHEEAYSIEAGASGNPVFVSADGRRLEQARYPQFQEKSVSAETFLEQEHTELGINIDVRTAVTRWQGERLDYGWAVGDLLRLRDT